MIGMFVRLLNDPELSDKLRSTLSVLVREVTQDPSQLRWALPWLMSLLPGRTTFSTATPWVTFGAIEWLDENLTQDMVMYEYGSGGSSLFFAERVGSIVSAEHDASYYGFTKETLDRVPNCEVVMIEPTPYDGPAPEYTVTSHSSVSKGHEALDFTEYVESIDANPDEHFDLVVVDGRSRISCVHQSIPKLKSGGYLLLDNAERAEYQPGIDLLDGWERLDFRGLGPSNGYSWLTSVFVKP